MKTRRARGGAFVRKGSYGCAFKNPPLKCKSEPRRRSSKELSKLLNDYKADKEYAESVPFQRIDPAKNYFLWAHHKCELNTANVKPDNRLNKCVEPMAAPDGSSYSVVNMRRPHPTLIFYELGGQDVSDIVLSSGQYGPFFASFLNLLKGLEVLHANHYAHLDIKPLNIVSMELPTGEFATRFIDFGLSMSTARASGRERSLQELSQFDYPYYPFDFRFISPTHARSASQQEINKWYAMMADFKNYLPQDEYYDASWRPRFDATNFSKLPQLVDFSKVEEILQEVDVYALGVSFGELYSRLTRHVMRGYPKRIKVAIGNNTYDVSSLTGRHFDGNEALATWHKKIAEHISLPLYELIGFMIDAVPTRRVSALEARTLFEKEVLPNIVRYFGSPNTYAALSSVGIRLAQTAPPDRYTIPAAAPGPAVVAPRVGVSRPNPAKIWGQVLQHPAKPVSVENAIAAAEGVLRKGSDPKANSGLTEGSETSDPGQIPAYVPRYQQAKVGQLFKTRTRRRKN